MELHDHAASGFAPKMKKLLFDKSLVASHQSSLMIYHTDVILINEGKGGSTWLNRF